MSLASSLGLGRNDNRLWTKSAGVAALLHAAALGALLFEMRGEIDEDAGGAPAIEISMEPAAPRVADAPDAPIGPVSDESAASASAVAASSRAAEDEKITRTQSEDADLSRNDSKQKPVQESQAPQSEEVRVNDSAASEAAAPAKTETEKVADRPTAPAQGVDPKVRAAILTWQKQLVAHLNRAKRYPAAGARRSAEVGVYFAIDRRGHVVAASVKRSSGLEPFDEAALAMMKRADPVPPPPAALADEGLTFEVPVQFRAPHK